MVVGVVVVALGGVVTRVKCFGVHILGPSLNQQIFQEWEILLKILILLVLLGKL